MTTATEFAKGSKRATVSKDGERWVAWVGYADASEGTVPARWFKGYSTCSNSYKTEKAAVSACKKFLRE